MLKILNWLKSKNKETYIKPQKFVNIKRDASNVTFIHPGHPLYDNIVAKEENQVHLHTPNETVYNETSLMHNFVAIVNYNASDYLVINSVKHFKEQSIGGLLQFDENIYEVIPFFEDEDEYQTTESFTFSETYEYDHPVENYAFRCSHDNTSVKITINRGRKPILIAMIDSKRAEFTEKINQNQIELIDYVVIPAINAYNEIQQKRKEKAS